MSSISQTSVSGPSWPSRSIAVAVDAPRQPRDLLAHRALGVLEDGVGQRLDRSSPYSSMNSLSMRPPTVVHDTLASRSPIVCSGDAHVGADQLEQQLVGATFAAQLDDRNSQALLVDFARRGRESRAPDVGQVRDAHRIADDAALRETPAA